MSNSTRGRHPMRWVTVAILVIAAVSVVVFFGWLPRHKRSEEINHEAKQEAGALPKVEVIKAGRAPAVSRLMIPGTTLAYTEASIYARSSGYLTRRLADIGDRVRKNQLLAVIDSPDLDQQVSQARSGVQQSEATLVQLQAQLHLASLTWDRYKVLVARGVFSRQDGDTQEANFRVSEANLRAAENAVQGNRDNLQRLIVLQSYEQVKAPFDGVVTARNVDVGALINGQGSGSSQSSPSNTGSNTTETGAQGNNQGASGGLTSFVSPTTGGAQGGEMFAIANIGRIRILVSVPEAYSSLMRVGEKADLLFEEMPKERYEGTVTRTSASIDANTRTLLVEIQLPNRNGKILPGMYVVVNFKQLKADPPIVIPGESIVVRDGNNMVAVVEQGEVHFRPVEIGRDYGDQTEIASGLEAGQLVAVNVSDDVREGGKIDPQFQKPKGSARAGGSQSQQAPAERGQYGDQSQTQSKPPGGGSGQKGSGGQGQASGAGQGQSQK